MKAETARREDSAGTRLTRFTTIDIAVLALLLALALWTWVAAVRAGVPAWPVLRVVMAAGGAWLVGRLLRTPQRWDLHAVIVLAGLGSAVVGAGELLDGGPLGYANASATLFVLIAAASFIIAVRSSNHWVGVATVAVGLAFLALPWLNRSLAGGVLGLLLPLAFLARRGPHAARTLLGAGFAAVVCMTAFTAALGASYDPVARDSVLDRAVDATLTERRVEFWHDAVTLAAEHPLLGVGPDQFRLQSRTALLHPYQAYAHSGYLQLAAEIGIPGAVLSLAVVACALIAIGRGQPGVIASLAGLAIIISALHASVDYVWSFVAVPLITGALAGAGSAR